MSETVVKRLGRKRTSKVRKNYIVHYNLSELLPADHVLVLNRDRAILSYLAPQSESESWPRVLLQEQFTRNEGNILFPLLENYPYFCPYEALVACYSTGQITDAYLDHYRMRLQEAQLAGEWDHEMRPVRNLLSRIRLKLQHFGIEVRSVFETGYMLKQAEEKWTGQQ